MSADPIVVLGVLLAFLRRTTPLGRVPVDDLYQPAELVDRLLRCLGLESEPDRLGDLMLAAIAATPNARRRRWARCQHGVGPGRCDVCSHDDQDDMPAPNRRRYAHRTVRHDARRPAGRRP